MTQITVLSTVRFTEAQLHKLCAVSPRLEVQQWTDATVDELPEVLCQQVEILYGSGTAAEEGHRLPQLKWIQAHSAGVDFLLDKPIWRSGVKLTSLSGVHPVPIAERVLTLMLALTRHLPLMLRLQQRVEWPADRWKFFARPELRGSTLGIVGYGAIGRELARQTQTLGLRVLAANRSGARQPDNGFREPGTGDPQAVIAEVIYPMANLPDMLPQCDYVVALLPGTPTTHHLFNADIFALMKPSAYFFNFGRGAVVDEAALVDALQRGVIAGAGLDVFEVEPLPPESPLWQMDNVIVSPHVGGFSPKYDERASDLFAENLRRYLAGEPLLNLVERERGY